MRHPFLTLACVWSLAITMTACGDETETGETAGAGGDVGAGGGAGHGGPGGGFACPTSDSVADCSSMCEAVLVADCPDGPTQADCESSCADLNDFVGACPAWGGVVDCMGAAPTFQCMFGEQVPAGCEEEFYCLSQCFDD